LGEAKQQSNPNAPLFESIMRIGLGFWINVAHRRPPKSFFSSLQGRFVAYFRVSTDRQGRSGLGLEAQREAVESYLNGGRWSLVAEFTEIESGKRNDRPELEKALATCKKQKARLVIAKLDRLSRNLAFIATLMDSGVEFIAVDNPHANKLTVHILAAVAQHEREIISARTSAALKAAKARGKRLGNPKLAEARRHAAVAKKERADRYSANVLPVIREIQESGIKSLRGVARALAARGIPTARGGAWTPVQVSAILQRARWYIEGNRCGSSLARGDCEPFSWSCSSNDVAVRGFFYPATVQIDPFTLMTSAKQYDGQHVTFGRRAIFVAWRTSARE
jgi:DNA invertase Pin-like site-specific DNA recombinase